MPAKQASSIRLKTIPQSKLKRYLELKKAVDEMKALKEELVSLARLGLPCQPGPLSCMVKTKAGARRPPWKEEGIELANKLGINGDEWAEKVIKFTLPGEPSHELVVVDRDNPLG